MKKNRKIIVVDDQQDLREQLAKLLRKAGKKDGSNSLVEQMRKRLLGNKEKSKEESKEEGKGFPEDTTLYIVDTAGQGEEALDMIVEANKNNDPYSVMFLDMRMPPGWDGLKTAIKVREIDRNIEIVIMTAYADYDQAKIVEQVGMPEKLLYIKKPFQAEEIYQLALSLTEKYSLEHTAKERKKWLEALLRGMSRIKSSGVVDTVIYRAVLQAILNFTRAKSGFIAEYSDKKDPEWVHCTTIGTDEKEAKKYLEKHIDTLRESRTTQNINGKYILPLHKEKFFAVAVINDVATSTDPEWYKLLSLLIMTCSEVLNNSYAVEQYIQNKQPEAVGESIKKPIETIKKDAESLKKDRADIKDLAERIIDTADNVLKQL